MSTVEQGLLARAIPLGDHGAMNGLLHCFGHKQPAVTRATVSAMLDASGTALLPINTHTGRAVIGHGDVTWDSFKDEAEERGLVPVLNINLQTSAARAVAQAVRFRDETGIGLLKLEVLNDDHATSNDDACIEATEVLVEDGFTVMPLVGDGKAKWGLLQIIPVLRVMGSPIGAGRGIDDPDRLRAALWGAGECGVPVILDGGIGSVDHARHALELGCAGFLVNSALFARGRDPVAELTRYREALA